MAKQILKYFCESDANPDRKISHHILQNKKKNFFFTHFFQNCADYETLARLRSPAASLQLFCGFFAGGRPATSSPTSKFLVVFLRQSAPTKHPLSRPCFSRPHPSFLSKCESLISNQSLLVDIPSFTLPWEPQFKPICNFDTLFLKQSSAPASALFIIIIVIMTHDSGCFARQVNTQPSPLL